ITNKSKESMKGQNKILDTNGSSGQNSSSRTNDSLQLKSTTGEENSTDDDNILTKTVSVLNPKEIWLDIEEFCEIF
ncbi:unnamed protein product, partial [Schistosoma turkestanicum]